MTLPHPARKGPGRSSGAFCILANAGHAGTPQCHAAPAADGPLAGKTFVSDALALDFTGTPLTEEDLSEIGAALVLLPDAKSVTLTACGLSEDALRTFSAAHPEILTIWETQLFGVTFTTDAEEIAGQVAFLLSDDAATITGAVLASDGGYSL